MKLKDAGYPQKGNWGYFTISEGSWGYNFETKEGTDYSGKHAATMLVPNSPEPLVYCPTLEELITACVQKLKETYPGNDPWVTLENDSKDGTYWSFTAHIPGWGMTLASESKETPDGAVTALWLELEKEKDAR